VEVKILGNVEEEGKGEGEGEEEETIL